MADDLYRTSFTAPKSTIDQLGFLLAILRKSRSEFIREAIDSHIKSLKQEILMARDRDEDAFRAYMQSELPDQQEKETECAISPRKSRYQRKFKKRS